MSEFIGSKISLISKSDIRYVGTLHEINSENSTVALENVKSFGTEDRKSNPNERIAGSDSVYEYIVFRGSDVKDLRIEQPPKENQQPPTPNDPAILSGQRPSNLAEASSTVPSHGSRNQTFTQPPPYQNQYPNNIYGGPPAPYGFHGPPPGRGFPGYPPYGPPGMPHGFHGGPPPHPGRGFPGPPPPGPFSPGQAQMPFGAPGPQQHTRGPSQPQQQNRAAKPQVAGNGSNGQPVQILKRPSPETSAPNEKSQGTSPMPSQPPPPPNETKPDPVAATAPPAPVNAPQNQTNGPIAKPNKIFPAMPIPSPAAKKATPAANNGMPPMPPFPKPVASAALQQQNANTQAATAAVAAAMAKLGATPGQAQAQPKPVSATGGGDVVDNLQRKVNEMRIDAGSNVTSPTIHAGGYGGRGRGRGNRRGGPRGIEVPTSDFDFESANAKFDKDQLSKEATNGGVETNGDALTGGIDGASNDVIIPPAEKSYDAKSSFFDNISSEAKEREEVSTATEPRRGGREFRSEDRRRNLETFGIGNVDGGFRGGYRGRGRGRGFRGRGYLGRGRGRGQSEPVG